MFIYFFICTNNSSQQIPDFFFYKTLISMVDSHGEKTTKHFDQCGSHDGQITDTITSNYILQTCNTIQKFQQTVVTFALTV